MSRADLARALGISATTASAVVADLLQSDLASQEQNPVQGNRGRPARRIRLHTPPGTIAGIDIGREHAWVCIADRSEHVLAERFVEFAPTQDREQTTALVLSELDDLLANTRHPGDLQAIGMGLPGPIEARTQAVATGTILPEWVGYDALETVREHFQVPAVLDNDANLGVLGEARHGAARGAQDAVFVKVSAGIGAGLLLDGRLYRGAGGTAGEIGHAPSEPGGIVCRCGSRGCLETVASVPSLLALLKPTLGSDITLRQVIELAINGDRACQRAITDVGRHVGRGLAYLCNLINPSVIVIGGPLADTGTLFLEAIEASLAANSIPASAAIVHVRPSELRSRAVVLGAIALADDTARGITTASR